VLKSVLPTSTVPLLSLLVPVSGACDWRMLLVLMVLGSLGLETAALACVKGAEPPLVVMAFFLLRLAWNFDQYSTDRVHTRHILGKCRRGERYDGPNSAPDPGRIHQTRQARARREAGPYSHGHLAPGIRWCACSAAVGDRSSHLCLCRYMSPTASTAALSNGFCVCILVIIINHLPLQREWVDGGVGSRSLGSGNVDLGRFRICRHPGPSEQ